jgi:ribonuclease BN (tRNA processing enzyme)
MRVLITGVGDAFTKLHFNTSAIVQAPEGYILIDCPDPLHRVLHEAALKSGWNVNADTIHDIIITHLHGDHSNGLETLGFWRRIKRINDVRIERPRLHITQQVANRIWEKLAPAMSAPMGEPRPSDLDDYFEVHILEPGHPSIIAGLAVHCRLTRHAIPTIGLLLGDGERTLGWSGDTPFDEDHIEWLSRSDLIVHESNLGPTHTPIEKLNALPAALKAKMRLIHLPDDFDPSRTDIATLSDGEVLEF